jgi:hypothetical protein
MASETKRRVICEGKKEALVLQARICKRTGKQVKIGMAGQRTLYLLEIGDTWIRFRFENEISWDGEKTIEQRPTDEEVAFRLERIKGKGGSVTYKSGKFEIWVESQTTGAFVLSTRRDCPLRTNYISCWLNAGDATAVLFAHLRQLSV